jgi:hypothetical protein
MLADWPAFPPIIGEANRTVSMRRAQCIPIRDDANGYKNTFQDWSLPDAQKVSR